MAIEFLECWIEKALCLRRGAPWWMSGGHHGCRWGTRGIKAGYPSLFQSLPNPEQGYYTWAFVISTSRKAEVMSSHWISQIHISLSKTTLRFIEKCLGAKNNKMSQCGSFSMCPWQLWLSWIPTGAFTVDMEPVPNSQLLPIWLICWLHSRWPAHGNEGVAPWQSRGLIRGKPARTRHLAELVETFSISRTWNTHGPQRHQRVTLACP